MKRTAQQQVIVGFDYKTGQIIVIPAYAGTGKTTSLVDLAYALGSSHPAWKALYLCYNKANQVEAAQRFPSNVECRTTHSLAWYPYGDRYKHKLGNPRLRDIRTVLPAEIRALNQSWEAVSAIYDATKEYMYSDYDVPSGKCFSGYTIQRFRNAYPHASSEIQMQTLTGFVKHLWMLMTKEEELGGGEPNLLMPHDGYLKLMQLDKPTLKYDVILFDEAQDANPTTLDIVLRQRRALKIFVGDEHQQIYAFRGSKNAMQSLEPDRVMELSNSFRFGEEIAEFASRCLNRTKGERLKHPVLIHGLGEPGKVERYPGEFVPHPERRTVITRTNATIIDNAWQCVCECIPFTIVGGAESTALMQAESAYNLSQGDKFNVKDPFLKSFDTWDGFSAYAMASKENESMRLVALVREYGHQLPKMISEIKRKCLPVVPDDCLATTFTTAHKSKGMEWPVVDLSDDFIDEDWFDFGFFSDVPENEANLLYVAITRAEKHLRLPAEIYDALTKPADSVRGVRHKGFVMPNDDLGDLVDCLDDIAPDPPLGETFESTGGGLHPDLLGSILKS